MKIELNKRYKIKFVATNEREQDLEGFGTVVDIDPLGCEPGTFEVCLEEGNGFALGYFQEEDFVESVPPKDEELANLKQWLKYISEGPERPIWWDDRDDAADELVRASERALSGESFEDFKKEYLSDE